MSVYASEHGLTSRELLEELGTLFPDKVCHESMERLTYLDTFDWRLFETGSVLTASPAGARTCLALHTKAGKVLETPAARVPRFVSDLPNGPATKALTEVVRHRRLFPRASAEWQTTRVAVLNEDEKTVCRLLLREGTAIFPGGREGVPILPRLRVLPLKGYGPEARRVTSLLKRRFGLTPDSRSELDVACRASDQTPGEYSSNFRLVLNPEWRADEAARLIHQELIQVMVANVEGIQKDWDIEFLHDFRVALRRARSALTQLKGIFPGGAVNHLSEELRWLGTRTGPVRDLDVYLLQIPEYRSALHAQTQEELEPLIRLLREKRRKEHRSLRTGLRSKRFQHILKLWRALLDAPDALDSELFNAPRPIPEVASEQIWRAFSRALAKGERIGPKAPAKALHRLRIDCKKLRYLMTFFQSLYPPAALGVLIKELKLLQDHLGDFNDAQVQREALRRYADELLATGAGPPATLLAMGQLMGQMEGTQARERDSFRNVFGRFSRPENRKRFQALFGPPPGAGKKPPEGEETP